jgi:TonB-linked SusC/RagA family outer membrane protein
MKLSLLILFVCTSGLFATETFSQVAKVTISSKTASFKEILSDIESQTDYLFVYDKSEVNLNQNVSLNARNKTVAEILNEILRNTDIVYAMEGNNIMLMKKQTLDRDIQFTQQSGRKISGKVLDETGEPVIGANVVVKGTTNGNITDIDGLFTLENVSENQILQISYIGYLSQEIRYTGQATLTIRLVEDSQNLDEVVVVGYGTQKKANLTGAVAQVTGDVLESRPIVNLAQGLQGIVPNLNVDLKSGAPGQSTTFNIRGNATILKDGGSPLVLVNNVQMDPDLINPEDIESISILKDAASAAIYGARAAYGVILITTKNGRKEQKPQVSFSANGYWQSPAKKIETINSMEFLTMKDLAYQNGGGGGHYYNPKVYEYAEKYFNDPVNNSPVFYDPDIDPNKYQYCGNTNWWDEVYKKASFPNNIISIL